MDSARAAGSPPGHDRHVLPEDPAQLEAAGVVGGDDGRAAGQGLEGDRGGGLERGGQHEQVGRAREPGHARRWARGPGSGRHRRGRGARARAFRSPSSGPSPAMSRRTSSRRPRTRAMASSSVAWSARGCSRFTLRSRAPPRGRCSRRAAARASGSGARNSSATGGYTTEARGRGTLQLARPVQEGRAVERDVGRLAVEAPEARVPAVVVPDLGPVMGEHVRPPPPHRQPRRDLVHPGAGVDVQEVGALHQGAALPPGLGRLQRLGQARGPEPRPSGGARRRCPRGRPPART